MKLIKAILLVAAVLSKMEKTRQFSRSIGFGKPVKPEHDLMQHYFGVDDRFTQTHINFEKL
jgi:hypothetical protein